MELTRQDVHNLMVFLERTQLTGKEAGEYCNLYNKLVAMQKEFEVKENVSDG